MSGERRVVSGEWAVKRLLLLLLITLHSTLTTACGFTPLYGKHAGAGYGNEDLLQYVYIEGIPNQDGQILRNALIDRFYRAGRPGNPQYTLEVRDLEARRSDLDLTQTASSTREQMRAKAVMVLRDRITGQDLIHRPLSATASYNVLESEFSTRVSRQDARKNALDSLAMQIENQLTLYFQRDFQRAEKAQEKPGP